MSWKRCSLTLAVSCSLIEIGLVSLSLYYFSLLFFVYATTLIEQLLVLFIAVASIQDSFVFLPLLQCLVKNLVQHMNL